jgi:hypothetical protein
MDGAMKAAGQRGEYSGIPVPKRLWPPQLDAHFSIAAIEREGK